MVSDVLKAGDKVDILRFSDEDNTEMPPLASRIMDVADEKTVRISMPTDKSRLIPLRVGERHSLCFYTGRGTFTASCRVKERYYENSIPILVMELQSGLEKLQRRKFFRVECIMDIQAKALEQEAQEQILQYEQEGYRGYRQIEKLLTEMSEEKAGWEEGIVTDISGGGMRFTSQTENQEGDILLLTLDLGSGGKSEEHRLLAQIISSKELEKRPGYYENRAQFVGLQTAEREQIIRFVFEEDRKRRKRERGMD